MRSGIFDAQDVLASALPQDAAVLADVPLLFEQPLLAEEEGVALNSPVARWCSEYLFVFTALVVLKNVFFPFVLWLSFVPGDLTATLQEATSLIFSVISIIILLGLGSISHYRYRLSLPQATAASCVINLPFLIAWAVPVTTSWTKWWWGVAGDGIQLWVPTAVGMEGLLLFPITVLLILVGRRLYVRDKEQKALPSPSKLR